MEDPLQPITEQPTAVKSREDIWREMGSQQYNAPSDVPVQPVQPTAYDIAPPKVGVVGAFIKGLPTSKDSAYGYNPNYQPTVPEVLASTLTDFIRSGTAVLSEWTPEYKAARAKLDEIRKTDPEFADQVESATIGAKLSNTKLAIKGGAAALEGVLSIAPWFKFGRAGLAAGELALLGKTGKATELALESTQATKNVLKLGEGIALSSKLAAEEAVSNLGTVGKMFAQSPTLQKLYSGGLNGFLYGGLYGLHAQDADWEAAAKSAALGGGFGIGLMGAVSGLAFLGKYGGNKALQTFRFVGDTGKKVGVPTLAEMLPEKWYANIFSVGSAMKKYYGEIGENFLSMYKKASKLAATDLGKIQLAFIDNGLMKAPSGFGKAFKGVQYVGDDAERMLHYNQVLRGQGVYADEASRNAAIAADPKLQFLDGIRRYYGETANRVGITKELLDAGTYLPKHTPVVEMTRANRAKLAGAKTQAEREAIFAANDPMVKEMVENSVRFEKEFKTLDEAYSAYYDYADVVRGGAHTPMGDNKMLQRMVAQGKAKTIEEARGKIIADLKLQKQSLTPDAASLDFSREVDLPWYDPNPSRVMQQYTFDASMRIEMAKMFGVHDEKINEMIGSIKASLTGEISADEAARSFEDFVRIITGQVFYTQKEQRVSAFLRMLQIPKLTFAQIVNLGQSLNTLLASDIGSVAHGLKTAFTAPEIRNAIERGVLMNQFLRQIFEYNGAGSGSKMTDLLMKYNGFTFTEMFNRVVGSSASDMWGSKNLEKLLSDYGITTAKEGAGVSPSIKYFQMYSPNTVDKLPYEQAVKNLDSSEHARVRSVVADINKKGGVTITDSRSVIGDTKSYGTENAVMESGSIASIEDLRYNAAQKGLAASQKSVLNFIKDEAGKDVLHTIEHSLDDAAIRKILDANGLEFRTIDKGSFIIYDEGAKSSDLINKVSKEINGKLTTIKGTGEFVGGETRAAGLQSYKRIISEYEAGGVHTDSGIPKTAEGIAATPERQAIIDRIKVEQPREYWALKELGIPVDEVLARGYMTPEEKALAAQTFVERTQFLAQPSDLPAFASSPAGKILFQFKTFTYQQARFVTNEIKNNFKRGDYKRVFRNLLILSTVFPMTGEVLADIRSLITQTERPTNAFDRYISDVFSAGTYGLFYDFYKSAERGKTAEAFLGATVGDAIRYLEMGLKAPKQIVGGHGDTALNGFAKQLLRQTGVGQPVVNIIYPSTQPGKTTLQSLMSWAAD